MVRDKQPLHSTFLIIPVISNRTSDLPQIVHACADIGHISSHLNKLTHHTPGGFRGLPIQCAYVRPWSVRGPSLRAFARFAPLSVRCRHHSAKSRRRKPLAQAVETIGLIATREVSPPFGKLRARRGRTTVLQGFLKNSSFISLQRTQAAMEYYCESLHHKK